MDGCYDDFKFSACSLCLNNNCSILTQETWTILKTLIPEMNISKNMDHVTKICNICTEVLQTTDKFRKECFNNDIQKINSIDKNICALCHKDNVDVHDEQDIKRQKDVLHKCFPYLEIDFKENSSCCKVCSKLLEKFLRFIKNCQETEEDIRSYRLIPGNNSQGANILEEVSAVVSSNSTTEIPENNSPKDIHPDAVVDDNTTTLNEKPPRHSKNKMILTNEYNCANCSYSANSKYALKRHMISHRALSETKDFKCEICNYQTKRREGLIKHMIVHKVSTELKMFKCTFCPYETKWNGDLKKHLDTHGKNVYKCKLCPFQTAHQKYLERCHMLKHRDKSKLKFYKCDKCPYQTLNKNNLNRHTVHTEEWFSCNWCTFKTHLKYSLKKHIYSLHTPTSEIEMFKCANCDFETKRKHSIKNHVQRHINSAQNTIKCEKCNMTLKNKKYLATHLRDKHTNLSEVQSFQCYICGLVTRYKGSIKAHIIHKHFPER